MKFCGMNVKVSVLEVIEVSVRQFFNAVKDEVKALVNDL